MAKKTTPLPLPTGACLCGCREQTGRGSYFRQGHDKRAESMIVKMHHGSILELVIDSGYGPGKQSVTEAYAEWLRSQD